MEEQISILICPRCKPKAEVSLQRQAHDMLLCSNCLAQYPIEAPGIPHLMLPERSQSVHEQHWDLLSEKHYEDVCHQLETTVNAIDDIHLQYCRGDVLEVGCGSGRFLSKLVNQPDIRSITGLDISTAMLHRAYTKGFRNLVHSPGELLPFLSDSFDTVASTWSSLKYVDRGKGYREIHRVLRKTGWLVFDLINYWPYLIDYAWWTYLSQGHLPPRGLSNEYILSSNMKDAHRETKLLEEVGFRIIDMRSVWYLPFIRKWLRRLGYWSGYWGSRIGYDTIFVCQKTSN